jgi:hypothetical protein
MNVLDIVCQVAISVLGLTALILVSKKNKWGFVIGLASQPFWFFTTFVHEQWGIFALSVAYAIVWANGIRVWFSKKPLNS